MNADRQAAALDRLRARGLGLAPHMVDGRVTPRGSGKRRASGGVLPTVSAPEGAVRVIMSPGEFQPLSKRVPGDTFELLIPAPAEWLNENYRLNRYEKAKRVKSWRNAAAMYARRVGLSKGLQRLQIDAYVIKPIANNSDPSNWAPTAKAVTDGLIDYGLAEDDNRKIVDGPFMHDGGKGEAALRIVITVLSANVTAA